MRAFVYKKHGGIDRLEEADLREPKVGKNRVLVEVHSIGLNPLDYRLRRGEMGPLVTFSQPRLIASDFSGRVLEAGPGVTDLNPGDRVCGMVNQVFTGTSAERLSVSRSNLSKSPSNVDDSTAAGIPLAALTAYQALYGLGDISTGKRVLVNGASGGVGTFATQIAKQAGAHVTAVTSHRNASWMPDIGADEIIDYTKTDFTAGKAPYDIVFDCYGNRSFSRTKPVLTERGIYISTIPAARNYTTTAVNPFRSQKSRVIVVRSKSQDLHALAQLIESGAVKPIIDSCFAFGELHRAYEKLETKRAKGKIVVQIKSD